MTPLAHRIVKELLLPPAKRRFADGGDLLSAMRGCHCFDVSAVRPLMDDLLTAWDKMTYLQASGGLAFLPAPLSWIEWDTPNYGRMGVLAAEHDRRAALIFATQSMSMEIGTVPLEEAADQFSRITGATDSIITHKQAGVLIGYVYAALAIINTPRIIGRRQHMPHRGLEKALMSQHKLIGKFPLNAWTEILLEVTPPRDASGEESSEAHLTGKKALHFCRAHLRIQNGKLVAVRSHWRGDPALGMKQSRYKVIPPRNGASA